MSGLARAEEEIEDKKNSLKELKNSTITTLYSTEQLLNVIKDDFKQDYDNFMQEVESLRNKYNTILEESNKSLTFYLDPNIDAFMLKDVKSLENRVKDFIDVRYKIEMYIKCLEAFIVKLNMVYNVAIKYTDIDDREKLLERLEKLESLKLEMHKELEEYKELLIREKRYIKACELVSYIEYTILKLNLRLNENYTILTNIEEQYYSVFKDYLIDEISDYKDVLESNVTSGVKPVFLDNLSKLINKIYEDKEAGDTIKNIEVWSTFLENETNTMELLRMEKVDKDKICVKILDRLEVNLKQSDVLVSPVALATIELYEIYIKTHDEKIKFALKFVNILHDINYKDLYFIFMLLDILDLVKLHNKKLYRMLKKYELSISYSNKDIQKKKTLVKQLDNKEYYRLFTLDENEPENDTLEELNLDYKIEEKVIYINTFYFKGLENIEGCLI